MTTTLSLSIWAKGVNILMVGCEYYYLGQARGRGGLTENKFDAPPSVAPSHLSAALLPARKAPTALFPLAKLLQATVPIDVSRQRFVICIVTSQ